jgi:hypothetical protein
LDFSLCADLSLNLHKFERKDIVVERLGIKIALHDRSGLWFKIGSKLKVCEKLVIIEP